MFNVPRNLSDSKENPALREKRRTVEQVSRRKKKRECSGLTV